MSRPGVGVVRFDRSRMTMTWDAAASAIFDGDGSEDPMVLFRERVHPDDADRVAVVFYDVVESVGAECLFRIVDASGSVRRVLSRNMGVEMVGGVPILTGIVIELGESHAHDHDIPRLDDALTRLLHDARHDSLTGALNRSAITQDLEALASPGDGTVSLMFLDVDDFKAINDSLGHLAGDAVLSAVADRIARAGDRPVLIGRMGGDEFVVALPDSDPDEAQKLASTLLDSLSEPVRWQGRTVATTVSIGVATNDGTRSLDDLLYRADIALYEAKKRGKNCAARFDPGMSTEQVDVAALASELAGPPPGAGAGRLGVRLERITIFDSPTDSHTVAGSDSVAGSDNSAVAEYVATPFWTRSDGVAVPITEVLGTVVPVESRSAFLSRTLDVVAASPEASGREGVLIWLRVPSGMVCEGVLPPAAALPLVQRMVDLGCGISVESAGVSTHATAPARIDQLCDAGLPVALHSFGRGGMVRATVTGLSAVFLDAEYLDRRTEEGGDRRLHNATRIAAAAATRVYATGAGDIDAVRAAREAGCAAVTGACD